MQPHTLKHKHHQINALSRKSLRTAIQRSFGFARKGCLPPRQLGYPISRIKFPPNDLAACRHQCRPRRQSNTSGSVLGRDSTALEKARTARATSTLPHQDTSLQAYRFTSAISQEAILQRSFQARLSQEKCFRFGPLIPQTTRVTRD